MIDTSEKENHWKCPRCEEQVLYQNIRVCPKCEWSQEIEDLESENANLKTQVAGMQEALIWCGGSSDFSYPDGKARQGWEKIVVPFLP